MTASALVTGGFIVLPLLVAAGFVGTCDWAGRRLGQHPAVRRRRTTWIAIAVVGWLAVTALAAASGVLRRFFRLPLELVMHQAHVEGIMPVQMSYSGWNYDIVTGITAGALGLWLARGTPPRWIVMAWNALGFALLLNVVTIAIVSTPPFRWFGDAHVNVFVTYAPFVWLPAILVTAALMSHLLVWRRLRAP